MLKKMCMFTLIFILMLAGCSNEKKEAGIKPGESMTAEN